MVICVRIHVTGKYYSVFEPKSVITVIPLHYFPVAIKELVTFVADTFLGFKIHTYKSKIMTSKQNQLTL